MKRLFAVLASAFAVAALPVGGTTAGRAESTWERIKSSREADFAAGMQAAPVRATATDFAGPTYRIERVTVNNKDFDGKNRADYNNLLGHNDRRMKEAMLKYSGIKEIPDTVSFSP